MALSPEERFALETYEDGSLSTAEKLARIQGYGQPQPIGASTGGGEMTPIGGYTGGAQMTPMVSEIPAIPSGPAMDPGATAQMTPSQFESIGKFAPAPPVVAPAAPAQGFDFTSVPQLDMTPRSLGAAPAASPHGASPPASAFADPPAAIPGSSPAEIAAKAAAAAGTGAPAAGSVDPSQVQFAAPVGGAGDVARGGPQYAVVGTDTFQPVQRATRGGFDPIRLEPGEPTEPEFSIDKKDGGLNVAPGKPNPPRVVDLEGEMQAAGDREEQAQLDARAGREYADDAILRQAVTIEDKLRSIEEERARQETERLRRLQEKQAQFQTVLAETTDPENPVDAYWGRKEMGDKVLSRLALFFGTLGSAKLGVKNEQMALLQQEIEADIQAQKDARRTKIEGARTMYDLASDVFESEAARDAAVREAAFGRVQRELERFRGFAQTPERQAAIDEALAQAEQARKLAEMQRIQAMQGEVSVVERFDPRRSVQVSSGKLKEDHRKRLVRLPDGSFAFSRDPVRTEKIQDQITVDASIVRSANRIKRLREQPGAKTDPKVRAQISGAAADLFLALKSGANLGTLDKGSLEFRDEWIGKPNDLIDFGGADALLNEVGRAADARVRDTLSSKLDRDPDQPSPVIDNAAPSTAVRGAVQ